MTSTAPLFVVQKHVAGNPHCDFRPELDGSLKSWAVPKGPSPDLTVKRTTVKVEGHLQAQAQANFEGVIPTKHHGAGTFILRDRGTRVAQGDPHAGYAQGKLKFERHGVKRRGDWALARMKSREGEPAVTWLLMKERDESAQPTAVFDVLEARPGSVRGLVADSKAAQISKATEATGGPQPATLQPQTQLATLVDAPSAGNWLYEIKFDGYRLMSRIDREDVRCITRNGDDWSRKLLASVSALASALRALKLRSIWLGGEIVVAGMDGTPDFQALQNALDADQWPEATQSIRYILFDVLFHNGEDLRVRPLTERRALLRQSIGTAPSEQLRFSESVDGDDPAALLESARNAVLEGLIGKRADSVYRSGRSTGWIKLKSRLCQEFVIGGYTDPKGALTFIGSLVLGVHDEAGALQRAGSVGTRFDERALHSLQKRLMPLRVTRSPFAQGVDGTTRSTARSNTPGNAPSITHSTTHSTTHWVHPRLIAEVSFAQWIQRGRVRHAVFRGLRDDKPAASITRGKAVAVPTKLPTRLHITHAERVIDPESGVTKGELLAYHASVAHLMLPHLKDRPVALLRAPGGVTGPQFFQIIDCLRNGWGATTAAAWSARARPGMGVSAPVAWDELDALSGAAHWTVRNIALRLEQGNRPWDGHTTSRRGLTRAMKTLGFTPQAPSTVTEEGETAP